MKKVFVCFACVVLVTTAQLAQASDGSGKISARATEMTRRMAERTRLSEGQYVKVRSLNVRLLTEMTDARKQFSTDAEVLDKTLAEVQMRYEWDLAAVLGPKQLAAYEDIQKNFTAANVR